MECVALHACGRHSPALGRQDLASNTINLTLAALRGVAREAWNLEYLTAEEYQRIKSVKGVSGTRLPAGRSFSGTKRYKRHWN